MPRLMRFYKLVMTEDEAKALQTALLAGIHDWSNQDTTDMDKPQRDLAQGILDELDQKL